MRATIKDVAKLAKVSTATVSNVITQKKFVSKDLEQRIRDAMDSLNYRPNIIARSLKISRSHTIGVMVPNITNPFFAEMVEYIQKKAEKKNYQVTLCNSDNDVFREKKIINSLLSSSVDGIINIAPFSTIENLNVEYTVPVVIVDRPAFETAENIGFVYADNFVGSAQVAEYFISLGYKRFACFTGPIQSVPNAKNRLDGFLNRLVEKGIPAEHCVVYNCDFTFKSGYFTMKKFIEEKNKQKEKYAVFATSDIMAWGVMESAKSNGLKIPEDVSIVGFDNIFFSNFLYPPLTTVENSTKNLGETAVRMLIDSIENDNELRGKETVLNTFLIKRET